MLLKSNTSSTIRVAQLLWGTLRLYHDPPLHTIPLLTHQYPQ